MNLTSIVIYVALIGFLLARRITGQELSTPKKLLLLPVIVAFIGLQNLSHTKMNPVDVGVVVVGSVLSFGLGALRGRANKLSVRDGKPWVRWGGASLAIFAGAIVAKIAVDGVGLAAGGTYSAMSRSLVLSLGLTLLGEAAVVWMRTQHTLARPFGPTAGNR
jgi:uncharacterized membrane protein YoaK (UPF0700 family)